MNTLCYPVNNHDGKSISSSLLASCSANNFAAAPHSYWLDARTATCLQFPFLVPSTWTEQQFCGFHFASPNPLCPSRASISSPKPRKPRSMSCSVLLSSPVTRCAVLYIAIPVDLVNRQRPSGCGSKDRSIGLVFVSVPRHWSVRVANDFIFPTPTAHSSGVHGNLFGVHAIHWAASSHNARLQHKSQHLAQPDHEVSKVVCS